MSKTARFHWYRFAAKFPKRRAPRWLSEKTKPRKSLVNPWIPARKDVKS